ncbi:MULTISPECIES: DUF5681 domain-containing protein [unclassified Afipia]|uniref:DUF5681 domain-containing protein n=1 Tax=unclassified Afipia TaxID=2642050 RepID=UPI000683F31A|nr:MULTISPECIES: DUF5681 domain-containing protein [unclassified Afipia]
MKSKLRKTKHDKSVGYCNPPKHSRFQKGISGNPSGRPKRRPIAVDPAGVLEQIDSEEIIVINNGKRKRMPKVEIDFRQLIAKATKGDVRSARLVFEMAEKYFSDEAQHDVSPEIISQSEVVERFGPNWERYAVNMVAGTGR